MDKQVEEIESAIKLLSCSSFKWKSGMATACGTRLKKGWQIDKWLPSFSLEDSPVPDLSDPATKGCLLEIVRTVSGDLAAYCCKFEEGWCVNVWPEPNYIEYYDSEGLALANYILNKV